MKGVLVTCRPHLIYEAVERASKFCEVEVVEHTTGDYADLLNSVFGDEPKLKLDDDDIYASDHDRILDWWTPGRNVWNRMEIYGCDGRYITTGVHISGAVIDPTTRFRSDKAGRVEASVSRDVVTGVGTRKIQCPARWSWKDNPPKLVRRIDCDHYSE